MLREYKMRNVLIKHGYGGKINMNITFFDSMVNKSCIVSELMFSLFGQKTREYQGSILLPRKQDFMRKIIEAELNKSVDYVRASP